MKITEHLKVLTHFAIRLTGETVVYCDPFHIREAPRDGKLILITHEHFDHLSPEDIDKVAAPEALYVIPKSCREAALSAGLNPDKIVTMEPGEEKKFGRISVKAVPAYNINKDFHRRERGWLGYVVTMNGLRYYLAGDTDDTPDAREVTCDVAVVPVGGTYTMTAREAAALVNAIRPGAAVPAHYGDIVGSRADAEEFCSLLEAGIECDFCRE